MDPSDASLFIVPIGEIEAADLVGFGLGGPRPPPVPPSRSRPTVASPEAQDSGKKHKRLGTAGAAQALAAGEAVAVKTASSPSARPGGVPKRGVVRKVKAGTAAVAAAAASMGLPFASPRFVPKSPSFPFFLLQSVLQFGVLFAAHLRATVEACLLK